MRIVLVTCHLTVAPVPEMLKNKKVIPLNNFETYLKELSGRVRGPEGQT